MGGGGGERRGRIITAEDPVCHGMIGKRFKVRMGEVVV
jgi:hypothetical protein